MLVLALTEIKQKQLHLEASRWKSQDGWASSPSSSHPHTLRASLFPGTRVEVLGDPWRTKCLDFFHPRVVDSLWLVIMLLQGWKSTCMIYIHTSEREILFHEAHTYSVLYLFWESGKGVFAWMEQKKLSVRCFYIVIIIMLFCIFHLISCYFLPPLLLWPILHWLSPPVFPASFLIHFTFVGSPFTSLFLSCCCAAKNLAGSPAFNDTGKKRRLDFFVLFNRIIETFQ